MIFNYSFYLLVCSSIILQYDCNIDLFFRWSFFSSLWSLIILSLFLSAGVSMNELPRPCRMMLLVNPQSGKGQALTLYNNHIQRMLNEAGVPHTLVITGESVAQTSTTQRRAVQYARLQAKHRYIQRQSQLSKNVQFHL